MVAKASRLSKQRQLDALARELAMHSPCPLRKTATHAVPGEGSPDAEVFFIGEAPGKQEDLTGRPFVGAAGKMLSELLEQIGLQRDDVFITSIEKFRPPKNRDPKPAEVMACFPVLEKQIAIIKPKIIVTLGRHALRRMLEWEKDEVIKDNVSMDRFAGKLFRGPSGRLYFPIHHPAAILYQRSLRPMVEKDFAALAKALRKLSAE